MSTPDAASRKRRGGQLDSKRSKRKRGKKVTPEGRPKQPFNAWKLFFRDKRPWVVQKLKEKGQDVKPAFVMKTVGKLWKSLHPSAKIIYAKRATELSKQYQKDVEAWKKRNHKGTGRPPTAFWMFRYDRQQEILESEEFQNMPHKAKVKCQLAAKKLAAMWKALASEEKQPYLEKYKEAMENYRKKQANEDTSRVEIEESTDPEESVDEQGYDGLNFISLSPDRSNTTASFPPSALQSPNESLQPNKLRTPIRIRKRDQVPDSAGAAEFEMCLDSLFGEADDDMITI